MREQGAATWIEQRIAELERSITAWKSEVQRRHADGTEHQPDPETLAKIEIWEREFKGLKSLREEGKFEEK